MNARDDHDEIGQLRQEVRRLRRRVYLLELENGDLLRRVAFLCRELERTRARITVTAFRTS